MPKLNTIVYTVVALLILFIMFSSVIMSYFQSVYTTVGYCQSNSTSEVTCTDCNNTVESSAGYGNFKNTCYATLPTNHSDPTGAVKDTVSQNNTYCWGCDDWGYRSTARGLFLLIFSMAVVGFALKFLWIRRN